MIGKLLERLRQRNCRDDAAGVALDVKLPAPTHRSAANAGPGGIGRLRARLQRRHGCIAERFHFKDRLSAEIPESNRDPWFPAGSYALGDPLPQSGEEQQLEFGTDGSREGIDLRDDRESGLLAHEVRVLSDGCLKRSFRW